ncbi:MAG: TraB family protein [Candidatus Thermoplasmatota archaeon]
MDVKDLTDNITLVGVDYLGEDRLDVELMALVEKYKPDIVGLALCEKRFETMEEKEKWLDKPLLPSYQKGDTGSLIYQTFMDAVRENLRKFKQIEPETHVAKLVDVADFLDVDIEFIDRDITLTFKRAYGNMSPIEKLKMAWYFKSAMFSFSEGGKSHSVKGMESQDDLVEGVINSLGRFAPDVADEVRKERLEYMAKKIYQSSKNEKILSVIPESKMEGIINELKRLKKEERREGWVKGYAHLEKVGKKLYRKALRWVPPVFFIGLAVYLFFFSDVLNIWRAWIYWFIAVGGMASLGALIGRGHALSIITSFLLAPFMSLTLIGPGWIAGYVEARVRNPKIRDINDLTASRSVNEFLSNNLIRPIMVGIFSNVFTWIGLFVILPLLISFF